MDDPISELRDLGLTIEIDQMTASRIWAELLIVHGRLLQNHYHKNRHPNSVGHVKEHFYEAYHAIAKGIVKGDTPDEVLERMIPEMVNAFKIKHNWLPKIAIDLLTRWLHGPISEWKGKRLKKALSRSANRPGETTARAPRKKREPNPQVLKDRETVSRKMAAEALGVTERTLDRHVRSGLLVPAGPPTRKRFKTKDLSRLMNDKKDRQT